MKAYLPTPTFADLADLCGVVGLLVALGLAIWLIGLIAAFVLGILARPRLEPILKRFK
jgi:hypothetical protein